MGPGGLNVFAKTLANVNIGASSLGARGAAPAASVAPAEGPTPSTGAAPAEEKEVEAKKEELEDSDVDMDFGLSAHPSSVTWSIKSRTLKKKKIVEYPRLSLH